MIILARFIFILQHSGPVIIDDRLIFVGFPGKGGGLGRVQPRIKIKRSDAQNVHDMQMSRK